MFWRTPTTTTITTIGIIAATVKATTTATGAAEFRFRFLSKSSTKIIKKPEFENSGFFLLRKN